MELIAKLAILADAAKYDASCASSGAKGRRAQRGGGIGSTESMGICHSYTPDGRCVSLLKILMTNYCIYECSYCVNRNSSNSPRARMSVDEIVKLTLDFYKRNYIEGLFLSSGIIQSADYTMEQLVGVARCLRETHDFQGYIHLKTIPDASEALIQQAGQYADRISINLELPTQQGLQSLAPEKSWSGIHTTMARVHQHREHALAELQQRKKDEAKVRSTGRRKLLRPTETKRVLPAGQSTQMIVGADNASDHHILASAATLYQSYALKRVYYSAFSPIPDASAALPLQPPPLLREHRLYQADWLMRFYGFESSELVARRSDSTQNNSTQRDMLALDIDPKLAWALRHPDFFPVDLNRATRAQLLRVPGIGPRSADRILRTRRHHRLRVSDLKALRMPWQRCEPFIVARDQRSPPPLSMEALRPPQQLGLFG